jgi:60 kDa SS-A/Ro ribonucleoprotein
MARTNTLSRAAQLQTHEGGTAVQVKPTEDLLRACATTMLFEDTFYEKGSGIASRIAALVKVNTPERVAEVARLCRNDLKLRHVPLWLAVQMALAFRGNSLVRQTVAEVVQRPDELCEIVALYWKATGDERKTPGHAKLPAQLKKGLAAAFNKFGEYQLAKWNRTDRAVKLKDVLFLVHAKPLDEEKDKLWKRLIAGTLATPDTWEVALSAGADKKETWTRLLEERKLGGMAMLMNLRNMTETGVDRLAVVRALGWIDARSRLLPFRFIAASKFAPEYSEALSDAMVRSVTGLGKLPGTTVLVVDCSGSMVGAPISARSKLDRLDAAAALGVLIREVCEDARVFAYANNVAEVQNLRGLGLVSGFRHGAQTLGGGTETAKALALIQTKVPNATRVILVTDEQAHDGIIPAWGAAKGGGPVRVSAGRWVDSGE